ncbi:MAG: extracellular solute-binding protein [Nitrosomonas sp.]|nr:extracellular solute-binding protein [Nitrosomonas sp.]
MSNSYLRGCRFFQIICTLLGITLSVAPPLQAAEVVVYSARIEQLIKPLFDNFTRETGITVKFTTDKEGALLARLLAEGKRTPADMLITTDAGNLWEAARKGLLQPVDSPVLATNIPEKLKDPDNQWFGLTVRARTIVYNTLKVKSADLVSYAALAEPKWLGRLCLRTSNKVYNQSLVAMMIAEHGEAETERIVRGWVTNLATAPLPDDTRAMEFVAAGRCDITLVNTYYFGRLMKEKPDLPLAIFWPDQDNSGVHINVSGAGITRYSKNKSAALRLLEYLSSIPAQQLFAELNMEFPANPQAQTGEIIRSWGEFKANPMNVAQAGALQARAVKLIDRAGYR